ncbi:MAG: FtsW/RodA/SpoVE family cell cycle protein [Clostridia bacterium]|nr:FtsW/RodA/SpoVE family cell cycle protein [Clostridia bacterium]
MNKNVQQREQGARRVQKQEQKKRPAKRPRIKRDIVKDNDIVRIKGDMDRSFLILVIVLICFGSVMVFSASYAYALAKYGNSYYFIEKQIGFVAVGLIGMLIVANVADYILVKKFTNLYFFTVVAMLIAVLLFGASEGEAKRWLYIPGTGFGVQPSEFMKLGLVLMLAKYFSDSEKFLFRKTTKWEPVIRRLLIPIGIVVFVCLLVALEKHFSGVIILFLIGIIVIFAAGGQMKYMIGAAGTFAAIIIPAILFVPYAKHRIDIWLHPENYSSQSDTWQTIQGLNAVGSGGFFGVGLGQSLQKHMFVSMPQNDFIFAIICEELGFVGAVATIGLFIAFLWRGIVIAQKAPDTFSKLVVVGIVSKVAIQAVLNMAVVTNTIPNTGISLPFFSYGGSSLLMLLLEMGIVLSISKYSYQEK